MRRFGGARVVRNAYFDFPRPPFRKSMCRTQTHSLLYRRSPLAIAAICLHGGGRAIHTKRWYSQSHTYKIADPKTARLAAATGCGCIVPELSQGATRRSVGDTQPWLPPRWVVPGLFPCPPQQTLEFHATAVLVGLGPAEVGLRRSPQTLPDTCIPLTRRRSLRSCVPSAQWDGYDGHVQSHGLRGGRLIPARTPSAKLDTMDGEAILLRWVFGPGGRRFRPFPKHGRVRE
jgi:hypothetical protein